MMLQFAAALGVATLIRHVQPGHLELRLAAKPSIATLPKRLQV